LVAFDEFNKVDFQLGESIHRNSCMHVASFSILQQSTTVKYMLCVISDAAI